MRAAGSSGFVPAAPGACGDDRTTVGLSGVVKAMSGFVSFFSAMATVMLDCDWVRVPSGAIDCRITSCEPGGKGGGTKAKRPAASLATRAWLLPFRSSSTVAPGAARPAITLSPVGSTRTTSNEGATGASRAAAAGGSAAGAGPGAAAGSDGSARRVSAGGAVAASAGGASRQAPAGLPACIELGAPAGARLAARRAPPRFGRSRQDPEPDHHRRKSGQARCGDGGSTQP